MSMQYIVLACPACKATVVLEADALGEPGFAHHDVMPLGIAVDLEGRA